MLIFLARSEEKLYDKILYNSRKSTVFATVLYYYFMQALQGEYPSFFSVASVVLTVFLFPSFIF